jgi:hypothetical protein
MLSFPLALAQILLLGTEPTNPESIGTNAVAVRLIDEAVAAQSTAAAAEKFSVQLQQTWQDLQGDVDNERWFCAVVQRYVDADTQGQLAPVAGQQLGELLDVSWSELSSTLSIPDALPFSRIPNEIRLGMINASGESVLALMQYSSPWTPSEIEFLKKSTVAGIRSTDWSFVTYVSRFLEDDVARSRLYGTVLERVVSTAWAQFDGERIERAKRELFGDRRPMGQSAPMQLPEEPVSIATQRLDLTRRSQERVSGVFLALSGYFITDDRWLHTGSSRVVVRDMEIEAFTTVMDSAATAFRLRLRMAASNRFWAVHFLGVDRGAGMLLEEANLAGSTFLYDRQSRQLTVYSNSRNGRRVISSTLPRVVHLHRGYNWGDVQAVMAWIDGWGSIVLDFDVRNSLRADENATCELFEYRWTQTGNTEFRQATDNARTAIRCVEDTTDMVKRVSFPGWKCAATMTLAGSHKGGQDANCKVKVTTEVFPFGGELKVPVGRCGLPTLNERIQNDDRILFEGTNRLSVLTQPRNEQLITLHTLNASSIRNLAESHPETRAEALIDAYTKRTATVFAEVSPQPQMSDLLADLSELLSEQELLFKSTRFDLKDIEIGILVRMGKVPSASAVLQHQFDEMTDQNKSSGFSERYRNFFRDLVGLEPACEDFLPVESIVRKYACFRDLMNYNHRRQHVPEFQSVDAPSYPGIISDGHARQNVVSWRSIVDRSLSQSSLPVSITRLGAGCADDVVGLDPQFEYVCGTTGGLIESEFMRRIRLIAAEQDPYRQLLLLGDLRWRIASAVDLCWRPLGENDRNNLQSQRTALIQLVQSTVREMQTGGPTGTRLNELASEAVQAIEDGTGNPLNPIGRFPLPEDTFEIMLTEFRREASQAVQRFAIRRELRAKLAAKQAWTPSIDAVHDPLMIRAYQVVSDDATLLFSDFSSRLLQKYFIQQRPLDFSSPVSFPFGALSVSSRSVSGRGIEIVIEPILVEVPIRSERKVSQ